VRTRARLHHQRQRNCRQAEETTFDRGCYGARVQHVVAEVRAVVDAGDDHVVLFFEQAGDREMHAIRRCAVEHEVLALAERQHAQRHVESERVAGAAAVAVGRDDSDLAQLGQGIAQCSDPVGAIAVVVADENLHCGKLYWFSGRKWPRPFRRRRQKAWLLPAEMVDSGANE
jgi:hypothetical protein